MALVTEGAVAYVTTLLQNLFFFPQKISTVATITIAMHYVCFLTQYPMSRNIQTSLLYSP